MSGKPRIIPDRTYVLEEKDLEETEELTIAAVIQEAFDTESNRHSGADSDQPDSDDVEPDGAAPDTTRSI